ASQNPVRVDLPGSELVTGTSHRPRHPPQRGRLATDRRGQRVHYEPDHLSDHHHRSAAIPSRPSRARLLGPCLRRWRRVRQSRTLWPDGRGAAGDDAPRIRLTDRRLVGLHLAGDVRNGARSHLSLRDAALVAAAPGAAHPQACCRCRRQAMTAATPPAMQPSGHAATEVEAASVVLKGAPLPVATRIGLWVGVQLVVAGLMIASGAVPAGQALNAAAGWWIVYAGVVDLGTLGVIIWLIRRQGHG